jgi:AcrR family transcriptional regulator
MSMFDTADDLDGPAGPTGRSGPTGSAEQPGRRHLSERQAEVMERLVAAAAEEAEERPYAEISVRTIARRAGLAPATAYTYFSGKDHLLAEVLWRRMQGAPNLVDLTLPLPDRVADTVRSMGFDAMGSPAVAVCTTALLGDGPDVKRVRSRLGAEITRRLSAALGPEAATGADPAVLNVLQVTYTGALLSAGMGHLAFDAVPTLMGEATALMTGSGSGARTGAP